MFNPRNNKHSKVYKDLGDTLSFPQEKITEILVNSSNLFRQRTPYKWSNEKIQSYSSLVITAYLTGGRISEILKLRYQDITIDFKIVNKKANWVKFLIITKKTRQNKEPKRTIPIHYNNVYNEKLLDLFLNWYLKNKQIFNDEDYLWNISPSHAYRVFAILGFNPHFFRKLKLTILANKYNFNIPKLQKVSGHKDYKSLVPYIQFSTADIENTILEYDNKE